MIQLLVCLIVNCGRIKDLFLAELNCQRLINTRQSGLILFI